MTAYGATSPSAFIATRERNPRDCAGSATAVQQSTADPRPAFVRRNPPRFDFGAPVLLPSVQGRLLGRQRCDHLTACTLTGQQDSVNFLLGVLCHLAEEPQCLFHITHCSRLCLVPGHNLGPFEQRPHLAERSAATSSLRKVPAGAAGRGCGRLQLSTATLSAPPSPTAFPFSRAAAGRDRLTTAHKSIIPLKS